jgi:hypothetical protein
MYMEAGEMVVCKANRKDEEDSPVVIWLAKRVEHRAHSAKAGLCLKHAQALLLPRLLAS